MTATTTFWVALGATVVGAAIIAAAKAAIRRRLWRNREQRVLQYLRKHTEDRPGKQYIALSSVSQGVGLDVVEVTTVADRCPLVFRRKAHPDMIGLHEQERSIYEERGPITITL